METRFIEDPTSQLNGKFHYFFLKPPLNESNIILYQEYVPQEDTIAAVFDVSDSTTPLSQYFQPDAGGKP